MLAAEDRREVAARVTVLDVVLLCGSHAAASYLASRVLIFIWDAFPQSSGNYAGAVTGSFLFGLVKAHRNPESMTRAYIRRLAAWALAASTVFGVLLAAVFPSIRERVLADLDADLFLAMLVVLPLHYLLSYWGLREALPDPAAPAAVPDYRESAGEGMRKRDT